MPSSESSPSRATDRVLTGLALLPAAVTAVALGRLVDDPAPAAVPWAWVPSLGVDLTLVVDGLALEMLLLIGGIGTAVFVYGAAYLRGQPGAPRLFATLIAFMAAMIGAVTVDNLIALVVFWELTSVTSFLLVGFHHRDGAARVAAQQALITTVFGGLVLLAGVLQLGALAGTFSIRGVIAAAPALHAHPWLPAALTCLFVGAFTKSAQWPFHFWLPNAMTAPTPVSALLHSATMVKLGIYLLARLRPAFVDLYFWEVTLVSVGAFTAAWAMVLTLRERDLKRILAWSTVSALGVLTLLIGLPGPGAAEGAAAFLLAHALYKAPLFFVAGNVDHCTGTRSIDRLAGMARTMPWTAAASGLAAISMAGVPLSFGYAAKDLIAVAKAQGLAFEWVSYASFVASSVSVAVASVAAIRVFWHRGGAPLPDTVHEASGAMVAAPLALAGLGILFGLAPAVVEPLLLASAGAMLPAGTAPPGLGAADVGTIGGTLAVFAVGAVVFLAWDAIHRILASAAWLDRYALASWFGRLLKGVPVVARATTTRLQHGWQPADHAAEMQVVVIAIGTARARDGGMRLPARSVPDPVGALAGLLVAAAALGACRVRDPFVMALVAGLTGTGTALLMLALGAPDAALTQFTVEVAFVVVVAAAVRRLRATALASEAGGVWRGVAALAFGAAVVALLLASHADPFDPAMADYFGRRSLPDAHGRNVVNVIIVDFRALDTLGEIVVILLMAIAAWPLADRIGRRAGSGGGS
ncbi:MAG: hydrogen gas-evolving membrane-bound hydrogenase subunit E [Vicinamibacterales bacterium]